VAAPPAPARPDGRNLQVQSTSGLTTAAQSTSKRLALVIGNAAYKEAPLANPVNDARAIAKALAGAGFTVILRENSDLRGMLAALREFGDQLKQGGSAATPSASASASANTTVGLFYYAGHGMQIKGRNYLIPVGAAIEREDEVAYNAVDAQAVLDKMEAASNLTNIMILDACRNNPFTRSTRSGQAGLAQMDAPIGTLLAYATSPGAVASDGTGANGLYTQHLLTAMAQPNSRVEDVFKQVRANVRRDSQGKQTPWESTSLEGDFYFRAAPPAPDPQAAVNASVNAALDTALWDAVKTSNLAVEVNAYLARYPQGKHAEEARARLMQLQPTKSIAPVTIANNSTNTGAIAQFPSQRASGTASNSAGYTLGDRWRYQTVDKLKKEVTGNWSRFITAFEPDGSIRLNNGVVGWTAHGAILRTRSDTGRVREYSPALKWLPDSLVPGFTEPSKMTITIKNPDGTLAEESRQGTLKVTGLEKVTVPAGEFEALRLEVSGFRAGTNSVSGKPFNLRYKEVFWYVAALRSYVASEFETFNAKGSLEFAERHELTSFSVRGADNLALR
jgi:uncharacterized caspase-like protein